MDAKRIVPVLQVPHGPAAACRLEMEGADGILFRDPAQACDRTPWVREMAGALSIPFAVEAPFRDLAEVAAVLEAGADKVVLSAGLPAAVDLLTDVARRFGRSRVVMAVDAVPAEDARWRVAPERDALAWIAELDQRGCGEILLRAEPPAAALVQEAARMSLAVLCPAPDATALAAELLLNGADGLALPDPARSPRQWKQDLAGQGLVFRD